FHAGDGKILADSLEQSRGGVLVKEQVLNGVADCAAGVAGLGVDADLADFGFHRIGRRIYVDVAVAGEMLENGDRGLLHNGADEALASAGDDEVDVAVELEKLGDERAIGVFDELDGGGVDSGRFE